MVVARDQRRTPPDHREIIFGDLPLDTLDVGPEEQQSAPTFDYVNSHLPWRDVVPEADPLQRKELSRMCQCPKRERAKGNGRGGTRGVRE